MAFRRLRELIEGRPILVLPGVYDGLSARLVETAGYAAAFVTGAGLSESRLGVPDVGLMGLEESLAGSSMIAARTSLMLIADADTGYGGPLQVHVNVGRFERAGLGGVMIEDQTWPKRCGHMDGTEVIDSDEMVEKVRAAVDARQDPDFIVKARTDAAVTHGIDEAIRRGNLYAQAGADLIMADALRSAEDIAAFARSVDAPVAVNMGFGVRQRSTTPLMSARELENLGVAVVIYSRLLTASALRGMQLALSSLGESVVSGDVVERPDLQVSFEELNSIMGLPALQEIEARFDADLVPQAKGERIGS